MQETKMKILEKKVNYLLIIEVINSNPNGGPDSGGMPRQIMETGHGYITDVCTKRKVRDTIEKMKDEIERLERMGIFVCKGVPLDGPQKEAMENIPKPDEKEAKTPQAMALYARKLKNWMCEHFYDVRAFGAVCQHLTKKPKDGGAGIDGAITGPVQYNFAESVDPINIERVTITRCAVANEKEKEENKNNTMGTKYVVPYGVYIQHCSVSPFQAKQTGFDEEDLAVLEKAMMNMYELDKAAARPEVRLRKLIKFEHESMWGSAPESKCYESVEIRKKDGVGTPNSFNDYEIIFKDIPEHVTRTVLYDN